jgi:signal peptidase I
MISVLRRGTLAAVTLAGIFLPPSAGAGELFGYGCCYRVASGSMKPTLLVGDLLIWSAYSARSAPAAGDLLAFRLPGEPEVTYIHRLIGVAGDRVQMIDGALHINGQAVKREQIQDYVDTEDGKTLRVRRWQETLPNGATYKTLDLVDKGFYDNTPVYEVPAGHYFVLGDNRDNATDSRVLKQVGYIPAANLIGKIRPIPLTQWGR